MRARNGFGRFGCMMKRLTENNQIGAVRIEGRVLEIAETKLKILEAVLLCLGRAERYDFFRIIDSDDAHATPGEQFAQQTLA